MSQSVKDHQQFKTGLKQILNSYPKLKLGEPSSFMLFSDTTFSRSVQLTVACHANMRNAIPNYWDRLITAVPKSSKTDLDYLSMLISGPFRGLSDLINLIQDAETGLWYLECTELDKWPANALLNFCIASRVPIENPDVLPYWAELVTKGYHPTLAFLIAQSNDGKELTAPRRTWRYNNHSWLDSSSDWSLIIRGEPIKLSPSYRSSPSSVGPTNVIWGHSQDGRILSTLSDEKIAEHYGLSPKPPKVVAEKPLIEWHYPPLGVPPALAPNFWGQANAMHEMQAAAQALLVPAEQPFPDDDDDDDDDDFHGDDFDDDF